MALPWPYGLLGDPMDPGATGVPMGPDGPQTSPNANFEPRGGGAGLLSKTYGALTQAVPNALGYSNTFGDQSGARAGTSIGDAAHNTASAVANFLPGIARDLSTGAHGGMPTRDYGLLGQNANEVYAQDAADAGNAQRKAALGIASVMPAGGLLGSAAERPGVAGVAKIKGYHGDMGYPADADIQSFWGSTNKAVAQQYANDSARYGKPPPNPNLTEVEARFKNPYVVDAQGANYDRISFDRPYDRDYYGNVNHIDDIARIAGKQGHDGLVVKNVVDAPYGQGGNTPAADTFAGLSRGTIFDKRGQLLFSNSKEAAPLATLGQDHLGYYSQLDRTLAGLLSQGSGN